MGEPGALRAGEALEDADRILEPVPARDLGENQVVEGQGLVLDDVRAAIDPCDGPVLAAEGRRLAAVRAQPDPVEDRPHGSIVEILVLGREGIDRGGDVGDSVGIESIPLVARAREDPAVGGLDQRAQEVPCVPHPCVGAIGTDVAAPDHRHVGERRDPLAHAGRLRVVEVDDVTGLDQLGKGLGVLPADLEVLGMLGLAQRRADAVGAVQAVVEALGDPEELGVAADDHPAHVGAGSARVGEQRVQQLGDAAADLGRVEMPDDTAVEQLTGFRDRRLDGGVVLAEN